MTGVSSSVAVHAVTATHLVRVPVTTVWSSPESPRPVDAPVVADEPDVAAWLAALDANAADDESGDGRLGLHGRVESQLLAGEPVVVTETDESGTWSHVVAPWQLSPKDDRGYPGWVPSAHLTPAADDRSCEGPTPRLDASAAATATTRPPGRRRGPPPPRAALPVVRRLPPRLRLLGSRAAHVAPPRRRRGPRRVRPGRVRGAGRARRRRRRATSTSSPDPGGGSTTSASSCAPVAWSTPPRPAACSSRRTCPPTASPPSSPPGACRCRERRPPHRSPARPRRCRLRPVRWRLRRHARPADRGTRLGAAAPVLRDGHPVCRRAALVARTQPVRLGHRRALRAGARGDEHLVLRLAGPPAHRRRRDDRVPRPARASPPR